MQVKVAWATPTSDYDVKLFEDTNGDGRSQDSEPVVGTSQNGATSEETVSASRPGLAAGKKYVLRVNNFAAVEPYTVTITYVAPQPLKPAQIESYTLTCERGSQVFDTQQVVVERGQVKQLDLRACAAAIRRACAANTIGLRSVKATRKGAGVRFGFKRFARRPVQIDVFQVSRGGRVIDERLVKRFKARSKAVTWNGRGARGDGLYFARYRMKTRNGKGDGDPARHAAAPQRPLLPPPGLLPARDLRPAAELQARAGRVRRQHPHAAADRLPRRHPGARAGDRAARQEGRSSASRPARWPRSARTA